MPTNFTVDELLQRAHDDGFRVGKRTIYRWLKEGRLVGYRATDRSAWVINARSWEAFVAERQAEGLKYAANAAALGELL